jgi:hypothetical protein
VHIVALALQQIRQGGVDVLPVAGDDGDFLGRALQLGLLV